MRGQFYIISATVIVVMITSLLTNMYAANPNMLQPISDGAGFQAYNFQRTASDLTRMMQVVVSTSVRGGIAEGLLSNMTAESSAFAEKNGMKLYWTYSAERLDKNNMSVYYNMSFKSDRMSMRDSFKVTRFAKWRQPVNITGPATGQVTIKINFTQNRVKNCSREILLYLDSAQQPANVTMEEYNTLMGWHYQIPLTAYAGDHNRTNLLIERPVDFTQILIAMFNTSRDFDVNSVRVVEYDEVGHLLQEVKSQFVPAPNFHYQANATGIVQWIMNGSTPAGTLRYYSILFDTLDNGNKSAPAYATDLNVTDRMPSDCYIQVNNSKSSYLLRKGNCFADSGPAGGLKNAWIFNGSGHDLIHADGSYGQYFNSTAYGESGTITSYNISAGGAISKRISYRTIAGTNDIIVNITAYSALPYYKMEVYSANPITSELSPVTEHHGGYLCNWGQDTQNRWAEAYSPFWAGEGYGIVGLNASVTETFQINYSCSRIRHTVNNTRNWTVYTIFRTPKFTAEDLYLEKYEPPNISIIPTQPYSGYCTSANITFGVNISAGSQEYQLQYGYTETPAIPYPGGTPVTPAGIQIRPEEEVSEIFVT